MSDTPIDVQIIERDLVNVDLQDRELINIDFTLIDRIAGENGTGGETLDVVENEIPNQLSSKQFQTNFAYKTGSLKVYFNGIRETQITTDTTTTFSFLVDIIPSDEIVIDYIKL